MTHFWSYSGVPTFQIARKGCIKFFSKTATTPNTLYIPMDYAVTSEIKSIAKRLQLMIKHEKVGPGRWGVGYEIRID